MNVYDLPSSWHPPKYLPLRVSVQHVLLNFAITFSPAVLFAMNLQASLSLAVRHKERTTKTTASLELDASLTAMTLPVDMSRRISKRYPDLTDPDCSLPESFFLASFGFSPLASIAMTTSCSVHSALGCPMILPVNAQYKCHSVGLAS